LILTRRLRIQLLSPATIGECLAEAGLTALTDMSYDDLEIGEGTMASLKFIEATFGNISDVERQKIRADLLTYCARILAV